MKRFQTAIIIVFCVWIAVMLGNGYLLFVVSSRLNPPEPPVAEIHPIVGKWQSIEDEKSIMEFFPDGSFCMTPEKPQPDDNGWVSALIAPSSYIVGDYRLADARHLRLSFTGLGSIVSPGIVSFAIQGDRLSLYPPNETVVYTRIKEAKLKKIREELYTKYRGYSEARTNLNGIKLSLEGYRLTNGTYLDCAQHPTAAPTEAAQSWGTGNANFNAIGFTTLADVHFVYKVTDATTKTYVAEALGDLDGDGNRILFVATESTGPHVIGSHPDDGKLKLTLGTMADIED